MASLPEGTVTFLFTDIEGSTRLLQELGDGYAGGPRRPRRCSAAAFAEAAREVGTEGDSFFVAFPRAATPSRRPSTPSGRSPVSPGRPGAPVRVRMGLHTGEATVGGDGYVGLDVHRAARIAAAGARRPGPALARRRATLAERDLPPRRHACATSASTASRTSPRPEHLFQLVVDGLPATSRRCARSSSRPNNLPLPADQLRRPRARARGRVAGAGARPPAADAHRPGRHRQDAPGAPGRRASCSTDFAGRRLAGRAGAADRPGAGRCPRSPALGVHEDARPAAHRDACSSYLRPKRARCWSSTTASTSLAPVAGRRAPPRPARRS